MLILLNIGNTNTQIGYVETPGVISRVAYLPTENLAADIIPQDCEIAAATVVPKTKDLWRKGHVFWIDEAARFNVNFDLVDFSTLGSDRIANAAALADSGSLPGVCLDYGTAITSEVLDRDGNFRGGAIIPGQMLMARALNDYTAQLPLVEPDDDISLAPGCNTAAAIKHGIDSALVGVGKELIYAAEKQFGESVRVIAAGGDRRIAVDNIDGVEDGGDDFTLRGIMALWELNRK